MNPVDTHHLKIPGNNLVTSSFNHSFISSFIHILTHSYSIYHLVVSMSLEMSTSVCQDILVMFSIILNRVQCFESSHVLQIRSYIFTACLKSLA